MYFKLDVQMFQWLFISILFMLLDMGSKYWIKVHYYLYEKLYLFPGINFFYVKNFGLAFGLCSSFSIYWYYFLIWIIFIIIMVFVIFLYKSIGFSKYINIAYTMLIGGSLGNLFDRIVYGAVIDFIDIHIGNWHWPVFNIADIEIFVANPRGFCAGVNRAINFLEKIIQIYGSPIYVRHELVHNNYVLEQFLKKGVIFIDDINEVPYQSILVLSAHGVSKRILKQAKDRNLKVFDATCPLVSKVHGEVERASNRGMEVIIIGKIGHPEIEGIMGHYINMDITRQIYLVESKEKAWSIQVNYPDNLFFVTQTTLSMYDATEIIEILRNRFPNITGPKKSDICYATINRQNALYNLAMLVDIILVIGSYNSSNSNSLVKLAHRIGKVAYLVNNVSDIKKDWFNGIFNIGITAGASTPNILVDQFINKLRTMSSFEKLTIEEMIGHKEDIFFSIPKIL